MALNRSTINVNKKLFLKNGGRDITCMLRDWRSYRVKEKPTLTTGVKTMCIKATDLISKRVGNLSFFMGTSVHCCGILMVKAVDNSWARSDTN